jgi:hypothetical protein
MLGMTLLLTKAAAALDQLCLDRISRDTGILTPEYMDPDLILAIDGAPSRDEDHHRKMLVQAAAQLRLVGAAAAVHAILGGAEGGRRRVALLALAGSAPWQVTHFLPGGGQIHCRPAADGRVYLLAGEPIKAAAHAPHAMRGYCERLWILPASHAYADGRDLPAEPPVMTDKGGPDSLSLDAALRDLKLRLTAAGEAELLAAISALDEGMALPLSAEPAQPMPRAPAVAA